MPLNYKDYYKILGIEKTATEKDVKSAYRRLARTWHPDANLEKPKEAEAKFTEIQEAYEVLGDAEKRRKYDVLGNDWQTAAAGANAGRRGASSGDPFAGGAHFDGANFGTQAGGAPSGFSDFFDTFFTNIGRRQGQPYGQKGGDLETTLDLTLTEAYRGGPKTIALQIDDADPACNGTGVANGQVCRHCSGSGRFVQSKRFDVTVPPRVREGQRIRLAGQGARGSGGGPGGDLFLVVHISNDGRFTVRGEDVSVDVTVPITTLVLGGKIDVPTLEGDVSVTIKPGTQNNQTLRLAGKGMPKASGGAGNQFVRLVGLLPENLTEREIALFTELASLRA